MVTENNVWREILKFCAWRLISKSFETLHLAGVWRASDAMFWNQTSDARFKNQVSDATFQNLPPDANFRWPCVRRYLILGVYPSWLPPWLKSYSLNYFWSCSPRAWTWFPVLLLKLSYRSPSFYFYQEAAYTRLLNVSMYRMNWTLSVWGGVCVSHCSTKKDHSVRGSVCLTAQPGRAWNKQRIYSPAKCWSNGFSNRGKCLYRYSFIVKAA